MSYDPTLSLRLLGMSPSLENSGMESGLTGGLPLGEAGLMGQPGLSPLTPPGYGMDLMGGSGLLGGGTGSMFGSGLSSGSLQDGLYGQSNGQSPNPYGTLTHQLHQMSAQNANDVDDDDDDDDDDCGISVI